MNIEFKDTKEAIAFGRKATPLQVKELKRLLKTSRYICRFETRAGNIDVALVEAFRTQFYREALEAAFPYGD